jgi:hypothetical protein
MILFNIISEQPLPNLLPVLALPGLERVIQFHTGEDRFVKVAAAIAAAARCAGCQAKFQSMTILDKDNQVESARQAMKQNLCIFPDPVVNITGGTKLMSLGAYLGAREFNYPIFYCDTNGKKFEPLTRSLPVGMRPFQEVVDQLTVDIIMAAHGKTWRSEATSEKLLAFGRQAWALHSQDHEAISAWASQVRTLLSSPDGKQMLDGGKLREALGKPLPSPSNDSVRQYVEAAVEVGVVRKEGTDYKLLASNKRGAQKARNLLGGSWLEWAAADFLSHNTNYADIRVGVEPTEANSDFGETDIVAVNKARCGLAIFSCKTSLEKVTPLEHLASLRDRANTLGGTFAQTALCLFRARDEQEQKDLRKRAALMNLRVYVGEEIAGLSHSAA